MQEQVFDGIGTNRRECSALDWHTSENFIGNSMRDLKDGATKTMQKKVLVDVKNRLALTPLPVNCADALKRGTLPTPAFGKAKTTSMTSSACKPAVGKKHLLKPSGTSPFIFVEDGHDDIPEVLGLPEEEEDEYEDLVPKSERYTSEQIHKLANSWDSIRMASLSNSPLKELEPLNILTPELQSPELDQQTVPAAWLQPVPLPSFKIWEDDTD